MREIKFRGKRVDNGEWVEGYYVKKIVGSFDLRIYSESLNDFIITNFSSGGIAHVEVDPATVGQYAGLKDKNGTEIYEGDIVMHHEGINKVIFKDGAYIAQFVLSYDLEWNESYYLTELENACEVIGNIHDNPEQLKGVEP